MSHFFHLRPVDLDEMPFDEIQSYVDALAKLRKELGKK